MFMYTTIQKFEAVKFYFMLMKEDLHLSRHLLFDQKYWKTATLWNIIIKKLFSICKYFKMF